MTRVEWLMWAMGAVLLFASPAARLVSERYGMLACCGVAAVLILPLAFKHLFRCK